MCSFITQHNETDVASFEGVCNLHADCRNVHQSCCPWIECSFLYHKPSPKAFQRIWQYIESNRPHNCRPRATTPAQDLHIQHLHEFCLFVFSYFWPNYFGCQTFGASLIFTNPKLLNNTVGEIYILFVCYLHILHISLRVSPRWLLSELTLVDLVEKICYIFTICPPLQCILG